MNEYQYKNQQEITCPFCGWKNRNSWLTELDDDEEDEMDCGRCEKPFLVTCHIKRTFSSDFVGTVMV